jgi:hypothetical protein
MQMRMYLWTMMTNCPWHFAEMAKGSHNMRKKGMMIMLMGGGI